MNDSMYLDLEQPISKERAIELLYSNGDSFEQRSHNCFDEYGNYIYPTDLIVSTPNYATGISASPIPINGSYVYS